MYGLMILLFGTVGSINMMLWTWERTALCTARQDAEPMAAARDGARRNDARSLDIVLLMVALILLWQARQLAPRPRGAAVAGRDLAQARGNHERTKISLATHGRPAAPSSPRS